MKHVVDLIGNIQIAAGIVGQVVFMIAEVTRPPAGLVQAAVELIDIANYRGADSTRNQPHLDRF